MTPAVVAVVLKKRWTRPQVGHPIGNCLVDGDNCCVALTSRLHADASMAPAASALEKLEAAVTAVAPALGSTAAAEVAMTSTTTEYGSVATSPGFPVASSDVCFRRQISYFSPLPEAGSYLHCKPCTAPPPGTYVHSHHRSPTQPTEAEAIGSNAEQLANQVWVLAARYTYWS